MPYKSQKKLPSELDWEVWRLTFLEGMDRRTIAQTVGKKIDAVDYHIAEGKRLIAQNVAQCQDVMRHLALPVSFNGLRLIDKAFRSQDPKYLDAAIRFLRNAGVTIETQELNVNHKDTSSPDQSFESVMQRFKSRSVDADIIDEKQAENSDQSSGESQPGQPGINAPATDQLAIGESISEESTPSSISKSSDSILPLPQSHTKNPKSDQESPRSDIPSKPMSRDEDY